MKKMNFYPKMINLSYINYYEISQIYALNINYFIIDYKERDIYFQKDFFKNIVMHDFFTLDDLFITSNLKISPKSNPCDLMTFGWLVFCFLFLSGILGAW